MICDHFNWFCHKVLPAVYDESLSYYEVLCKLTEYIKGLSADQSHLLELMEKLNTNFTELQNEFTEFNITWENYQSTMNQNWQQYQDSMDGRFIDLQTELHTDFDTLEIYIKSQLVEMQDTLDAIKNGEYVDLYLDSIKAYIDENLQTLVSNIAKFITFGLTKDGHLAVYIPENWAFLEFSTPNDPESDFYGHLVLQY